MMHNHEWPFVSVIVLNFNGLVFLERCLFSLEQLDYPRERLEVILVDNASTDGSVAFVRDRFPRAKIVQNESNLGFAAGNNVGIRASKGRYIALLNNDTRVEKDWLTELVKVCEEDPSVGACTSKILLFDDRLLIRLRTDPFKPSLVGIPQDPRELGVLVEGASVRGPDGDRRVEFVEGFYPEDRVEDRVCRWSAGEAALSVPVKSGDRRLVLQLRLSNPRPYPLVPTPVSLSAGERRLSELMTERGARLYEVPLGWDVLQHARPVIQNAGSMILPDGSGRDRGAVVRDSQQTFEPDCGQYDHVEEVFAACGAGALYRRAMLEDVGLLDEYLFMYYEDTDLAWRARLKGWKIMYTPRAMMRHVHCGTSVEWSPFFLFHTYRNRLAMLLKNAPIRLVAREWTKYIASLVLIGLRICGRHLVMVGTSRLTPDFRERCRAMRSLVLELPDLCKKRRAIQRSRRIPDPDILRWMHAPGTQE